MDWSDDAFVLTTRPHGESSAVVTLLTRGHGRHGGLVRSVTGKAARGVYQPGNRIVARWSARLSEHLGNLSGELVQPNAALLLSDPLRLAGLTTACAMADAALPEREPHTAIFDATAALVEALGSDAWPTVYVHWELALLRELGFGLDLSACAATGGTEDLVWVSPKTGRAVCRAAGEPYRDRLFVLPAFLIEGGEGDAAALRQALDLTGHFLERHVFHRALPPARARLVDRLAP